MSGTFLRNVSCEMVQMIEPCTNSLLSFAPDPYDVGTAQFFAAVSCGVVGLLTQCLYYLDQCMESAWVGVDRNLCLCLFARGKALQRLGKHVEAIRDFDKVLEMQSDHAHAVFRRAWSHKVSRAKASFLFTTAVFFLS